MRLFVHEDGVATIPVWIEKCQSLGGEGQVYANVGNDEDAFKRRTF